MGRIITVCTIGVLLSTSDAYGYDTSHPTKNSLAWATGSGAITGGIVGFSAGYSACVSMDCDTGMGFGALILPSTGFIGGGIIGAINSNRRAGGSRTWSIALAQLSTVVTGLGVLVNTRSDGVAAVGATLIILGPSMSSAVLGYTDKSAISQSLTFAPILSDNQQGLALTGTF